MKAYRNLHKRTIYIGEHMQTEELLATPLPLPVAYAETPNISFTVTQDMLPVVYGATGIGYGYYFFVDIVATKPATGTACYLYAEVRVNGAIVTSPSVNMSSTYLSVGWVIGYPIKVGDLVEIYLREQIENYMSLVAWRKTVFPTDFGLSVVKNKNMYMPYVKVTEYTALFSGTMGRTATFSAASDNLCVRIANDKQTSPYTGTFRSYSWSSMVNTYATGVIGVPQDTIQPKMFYMGLGTAITSYARGTTDTTVTLPYMGVNGVKKIVVPYKML